MNNKMWRIGFVILWISALFSGCDLINPEEPNPSTIRLNPFLFQVQPGQGTMNNRITEVWVYADGDILGAFAPPTDIRYLQEGPVTLTFRPGIRNNGIANDAIVYPLFEGDTFEIMATPESLHEINPVTSYKKGAIFSLVSDFELANDFVDNRDTNQASKVVQSQVDVFEGNYSGQITMTAVADFIEVGNSIAMSNLPANGKPTYLELRYKNQVEFSIGLLGLDLEGHEYSNFFYLVKPTDEWNMLYIELTDLIKDSALPSYKVFFRSLYPPSATQPELNIFLDNIKVVHL